MFSGFDVAFSGAPAWSITGYLNDNEDCFILFLEDEIMSLTIHRVSYDPVAQAGEMLECRGLVIDCSNC